MRRTRLALALCVLLAPVAPLRATAADTGALHDQIAGLVASEFRALGTAPVIVEAVLAGNAAHAASSQAEIDGLDAAWRAELDESTRPTIDQILNNAASDYLRGIEDQAPGRIMEAFVMDMKGLNVAAAQPTSDFWQGDEDRFLKTYPLGPEAIHVGEIEFDESSQTYQVQVSFTLTDPATGAPIGAMTLGLNAETLN